MGNLLAIQGSYPVTGAQLIANLEAAVLANDAQNLTLTPGSTTAIVPGTSAPINGGIVAGATDQTLVGGRLIFAILPVPAAVTLTTNGTAASTTYNYVVEALLGLGNSGASATTAITTGAVTLTAVNSINIVFLPVAGATSYNVRRTVGGATQGIIKNVLATGAASYTVVDTGIAADGSVTPSINTSGLVFASEQGPFQILAAATDAVIIPAGRILCTRGSAGAYTLALPISGKPAAGGMDGCTLNITTTAAQQHTITTPTNGFDGASHIFTFPATARATLTIVANAGTWTSVALGGGALS